MAKSTLKDALSSLRALMAEKAVLAAQITVIEMKYLSRDGADASAKLRLDDGSPASENSIREILAQQKDDLATIEKEIAQFLAAEV